jgi:hypothetical protein
MMPHGSSTRRYEANIKMNLGDNRVGSCGLDLSSSREENRRVLVNMLISFQVPQKQETGDRIITTTFQRGHVMDLQQHNSKAFWPCYFYNRCNLYCIRSDS